MTSIHRICPVFNDFVLCHILTLSKLFKCPVFNYLGNNVQKFGSQSYFSNCKYRVSNIFLFAN